MASSTVELKCHLKSCTKDLTDKDGKAYGTDNINGTRNRGGHGTGKTEFGC